MTARRLPQSSARASGAGIAAAVALLLSAAPASLAAPAAGASSTGKQGPLVSGYGGPGAGEQAILGAQLLSSHGRGPGGGSGEGRGSSGAGSGSGSAGSTPQGQSSATGSGSSLATAAGGSGTGTAAGRSGRGGAAGGSATGTATGGGGTGTAAGALAAAGRPYATTPGAHGGTARQEAGRSNAQSAVVASQPLGLSTGGLVAVLVVACALVAGGFLTKRLAKGER
jgi:hypothetical protein